MTGRLMLTGLLLAACGGPDRSSEWTLRVGTLPGGGHRRAIVSHADGAGSSRTTAEFPIAGLERHRAAFLASCGERDGKR
jgi:hypothetical protein